MPKPRRSHNTHLFKALISKIGEYSLEEIEQKCATFRYEQRAKKLRQERAREERLKKEEARRKQKESDQERFEELLKRQSPYQ